MRDVIDNYVRENSSVNPQLFEHLRYSPMSTFKVVNKLEKVELLTADDLPARNRGLIEDLIVSVNQSSIVDETVEPKLVIVENNEMKGEYHPSLAYMKMLKALVIVMMTPCEELQKSYLAAYNHLIECLKGGRFTLPYCSSGTSKVIDDEINDFLCEYFKNDEVEKFKFMEIIEA